MRVRWWSDEPGYKGGAEFAAQELRDNAPSEVDFVEYDEDLVVLHNCVQMKSEAFTSPFVKVVHDVWPEGDEEFRRYILDEADLLVFSSPLHVEQFPYPFRAPYIILPPAMYLTPFKVSEKPRDRDVLWLANNLSGLKGRARAVRWAYDNRCPVDYYGLNTPGGVIEYDQLPELMGHYKRFLYLPNELEPFGRTVAEAWASGLELLVDDTKIGALWWIEHRPEDIGRGVELFWQVVLERFKPAT